MKNIVAPDINTSQPEAYQNGEEHITDELRLLDLRIRLQLQRQKMRQAEGAVNQFKGLVVSEEEVEMLLSEPCGSERSAYALADWQDMVDGMEAYVQIRVKLSCEQGIFLPLEHLSWAFDLNNFARSCLVLGLAVEYNRKYEKLFAFLQDDINIKYPTIDLALQLLCRDDGERRDARHILAMDAPLMKYLLKSDETGRSMRLSQSLKPDRRIIAFFHQVVDIDSELAYYVNFYPPDDEQPPLLLDLDVQSRLRSWWKNLTSDRTARKPLGILTGPSGSGKCFQIQHLCNYYKSSLLIINAARLPGDEVLLRKVLHDIIRECLLFNAVPCFKGLDRLAAGFNLHENEEADFNRGGGNIFLRALEELPEPIFLLTEKSLQLAELERNFAVLLIELGIPNELSRKELWDNFSRDYVFSEIPDWGQMASKFRFTPGQIRNALLQAHEAASSQGKQITAADMHRACFAQGRHFLSRSASKINPRYNWDDIILPADTIELLTNACSQMKNRYIVYGQWGFEKRLPYGRGLSMLFSGLPGTGKTMAAQVIARELSLELYRIDLAQIVSKYIGETEKNLGRIFREAELSNAILFFDEADALFGKRSEVKDAHDRYSNIEIAYLLQKVEEYDGISILATNLSKNMDEAFLRRITFIIEFPFPDVAYRKRIWQSMFPPETPIHKDVDFDFLARRFEIAGGNIKNIVLAAAFLAAQDSDRVNMNHLLRATKYEYQKIGRVLLKEDLGEYYGEV